MKTLIWVCTVGPDCLSENLGKLLYKYLCDIYKKKSLTHDTQRIGSILFKKQTAKALISPVSAVGRASSLVFGRLRVHFPGQAHSFTSCQLLVKGWALST